MSGQQDLGMAVKTLLNYLGQRATDGFLTWLTFKGMDNVVTPLLGQLINQIRSGQQPSPSEIEKLRALLLQQAQSQSPQQAQSTDQLVSMVIQKLQQAGYVSQPPQSTPQAAANPLYAPPPGVDYIRSRINRLESERDNLQSIKNDLQRQYYGEFDDNKRREIERRLKEIDDRIRELDNEMERLRMQLPGQTY
ncbi:hypothetical protein [Thermocladium modestius]|nr:hypothetical protein [Thermocladium modestius]